MKPVIGITTECRFDPDSPRSRGKIELNWNYAEEVAKAGGVPLLIPPTADPAAVAPLLDGLLVPGGYDIDAARFGQENHPKAELQDPARYEIEAGVVAAADPGLPIFGICYGCQFLNVAMGGTLQQHVPDAVGHEQHSGGTLQTYAIAPGTRLAAIVGAPTAEGQSWHHQAVDQIAPGLRVSARHADGTVEAVETEAGRWAVGVQWHPERTPEDPATRRLFAAFIDAARAHRAARRGPDA